MILLGTTNLTFIKQKFNCKEENKCDCENKKKILQFYVHHSNLQNTTWKSLKISINIRTGEKKTGLPPKTLENSWFIHYSLRRMKKEVLDATANIYHHSYLAPRHSRIGRMAWSKYSRGLSLFRSSVHEYAWLGGCPRKNLRPWQSDVSRTANEA